MYHRYKKASQTCAMSEFSKMVGMHDTLHPAALVGAQKSSASLNKNPLASSKYFITIDWSKRIPVQIFIWPAPWSSCRPPHQARILCVEFKYSTMNWSHHIFIQISIWQFLNVVVFLIEQELVMPVQVNDRYKGSFFLVARALLYKCCWKEDPQQFQL